MAEIADDPVRAFKNLVAEILNQARLEIKADRASPIIRVVHQIRISRLQNLTLHSRSSCV